MPDMPIINIEQQAARIGIHTTNAKVHASTPRPKMRIISERPRMEVERQQPVFKVKQQPANYQAPPPPAPAPATQNTAQYAADKALGGDYAAGTDGNAPSMSVPTLKLSKAHYDSASIKNQSVQQSLPSIEWEKGYINISWSHAQMQIEWDGEYLPSFAVEPHAVEIFLRERPYIKITVSDEVIAAMFGPQIDQEV